MSEICVADRRHKFRTIVLRPGIITFSFKDLLDKLLPTEGRSLSDLKSGIELSFSRIRKPIYIFIDDLDRLDPVEVQTVFKLIRLVADFGNITYVLALDEDVVVQALKGLYKNDSEQNPAEHARKYLEKFIQLPIYLPRADLETTKQIAWKKLEEMFAEHGLEDQLPQCSDFERHVARMNWNLRSMHRFFNTLELMFGLIGLEVDPWDLILLTMIKTSNSQLYDYIYTRSEFFLAFQSEEKRSKESKTFLSLFPDRAVYEDALKEILPYSPQLWNLGFNPSHPHAGSGPRLMNLEYFDRYFRYDIPHREAPQSEIAAWLDNLQVITDNDELLEKLNALLATYEPNDSLEKIRRYVLKFRDEDRLIKLLTAARLLFEVHYRQEREADHPILSSIVTLAKTLCDKLPGKVNEFLEQANLALAVPVYNGLSIPAERVEELRSLMRRRLMGDLEVVPELTALYSVSDAMKIFDLWLKLEADKSRISATATKWVQDRASLNRFLQYAFFDPHIFRHLFIDVTLRLVFYLYCSRILQLLPYSRFQSMLVEQLPDKLEELEQLKGMDNLHLIAFSYGNEHIYEYTMFWTLGNRRNDKTF